MANTMAKMRKVNNPYEVWRVGDWEWRILKKWQVDDSKPFARWFCAVMSPYTQGSYDMGDSYAQDIIDMAYKVDDISTLDPWRVY
jgi:hypothetical protein